MTVAAIESHGHAGEGQHGFQQREVTETMFVLRHCPKMEQSPQVTSSGV